MVQDSLTERNPRQSEDEAHGTVENCRKQIGERQQQSSQKERRRSVRDTTAETHQQQVRGGEMEKSGWLSNDLLYCA